MIALDTCCGIPGYTVANNRQCPRRTTAYTNTTMIANSLSLWVMAIGTGQVTALQKDRSSIPRPIYKA
ncbi:hypothetical protein J2Y02_003433 [Neobacillus drentensis]|nr:hypothetical protein [Neobacillus drentensis]